MHVHNILACSSTSFEDKRAQDETTNTQKLNCLAVRVVRLRWNASSVLYLVLLSPSSAPPASPLLGSHC